MLTKSLNSLLLVARRTQARAIYSSVSGVGARLDMNPAEFWKNFRLGEELSISGAFTYNGLRRFYELRKLDQSDEIFEVFYNLRSVC